MEQFLTACGRGRPNLSERQMDGGASSARRTGRRFAAWLVRERDGRTRCTVLVHGREGQTRMTWWLVCVNSRVRRSMARTRLSWRNGARPFVPWTDLHAIFAFSAKRRPFMLVRLLVVPFRKKKNSGNQVALLGFQDHWVCAEIRAAVEFLDRCWTCAFPFTQITLPF